MSATYPKRLIEVDLPIKKISEHARREKSIRHGHISTLHIWWARRPLAACRAVICAALWPDPADEHCPEPFRAEAKKQMEQFWNPTGATPRNVEDLPELRKALLDFIADFANWDNSTDERYLNTARALTQSAHEALGGAPGTRPLVVDPFAGGGSIPLEALRVGADAYASDLNPVAVLLNKVVLEYIPKYGQELADEVKKWGQWVKDEAEKELAEYYPKDPDGSTPIAYLWARTITCEGPGCGCEVPLIRSLWLAKKGKRSVALRLIPNPDEKRVDFEIIHDAKPSDVKEGTVKRGSATCPCCGYTTPVASVRKQLKERHGGADDARMFCVVTTKPSEQGRFYRIPTQRDLEAVQKAKELLERQKQEWKGEISLIPDEKIDVRGIRHTWAMIYGFKSWGEIFGSRQSLSIITLLNLISKIRAKQGIKQELSLNSAIQVCLCIGIDRQIDALSSLTRWQSARETNSNTFGRQALPMMWDFVEPSPISESAGSWKNAIDWINWVIEANKCITTAGFVEKASATNLPLPDDSACALITDPPYYDSVPYAYLSDFFYVWLKRSLYSNHLNYLATSLVPKDEEIVVDRPHELSNSTHDIIFYETELTRAFNDSRRILKPNGVGVIVFASKTTSSWEAILQSVANAGYVITGSWPIDTEMESRVAAQNQARLGSSIHIVCRPRENLNGSLHEEIGEWSDVLAELPLRIREWMPRLRKENVVGADAIFACLGPALEIFSRYSCVEKASGEQVTLKEYLEKVWEAVEQEALKTIFDGVDASGFEEDARLTAMWLWTLKAGANGDSAAVPVADEPSDDTEDDAEETSSGKSAKNSGYALEYDAARKISQGLGIHPEKMPTLIEVRKGEARLLSAADRAPYLFGKQDFAPKRRTKKRETQLTLFPGESIMEEPVSSDTLGELSFIGKTTLDRVHQSMLLFGNGHSEELKKFLVDDGVGKDPQFKKLAQALVALYPSGSDEKRWAEGVMSRMKGLGL